MNRAFTFLTATLAMWALWLIFAGTLHGQEIIAGGVVAVLTTTLSMGVFSRGATPALFSPKRIAYALAYVPFLLWSIVLANLDVARRVLTPKLDINPGIVKIHTKLESPVGRLILINSITLTPGTLSVDVIGDDLYIHWIDVKEQDMEAATRKIAASFEKYLEVIFG